MKGLHYFPLLLLVIALSCSTNSDQRPLDGSLFTLVPAERSGLDFTNKVVESDTLNYYRFMHLYIGAGVAAGDLNNDGLPDLVFNSNLGKSRCYINKGNLTFEDITESAGFINNPGFTTGVTLADVNNDGWLDIYMCRSGWFTDPRIKQNMLYINNGDLTFTEQAGSLGLNDYGNSIQASFFDYDKDGDQDMYLVNTPVEFQFTSNLIPLDQVHNSQDLRKFNGYDKLYRNDNGKFKEVSQEAGILSDIAFGLSVITADLNQDGWTDIFVGNDFMTPDYVYINNQNGTFTEDRNNVFRHTSFYSMGTDAADINQDGLLDLIVLDMLPEDYKRSKTSMEMVDPKVFYQAVDWGYNHQYMHNVLHLNNGNQSFREIGHYAGITKTDWSWSPILADFDNDGFPDLFVTNGIKRDVTEQDHKAKIQQLAEERQGRLKFSDVVQLIPSQKLPNFVFQNNGDLTFTDMSTQWGVAIPSFSNGAAAADFDNDGDLDLVTNNVNETAFLLENHATQNRNNYLQIRLKGGQKQWQYNSKIYLRGTDNRVLQFQELLTTRGYSSRSDELVHFGLGSIDEIPVVEVVWANGKRSVLKDVKANQTIEVSSENAALVNQPPLSENRLFEDATANTGVSFQHTENRYNDFQFQILLPHRQSQNGPSIAIADVNGDGFEDFYIGGATGQPGQLFLQTSNATFRAQQISAFELDASYEDIGSVFFDADQDGDQDLYVVSGGIEFLENLADYQDRLYLNNGAGDFHKASGHLPEITSSGSCAVPADFDQDGDLDLFVGGRIVPHQYPIAPESMLLRNNGAGRFEIVTDEVAPGLKDIGMVTSALWTDLNGDNAPDLILTGEWMGIHVFENQNNKLAFASPQYGLDNLVGWWNSIVANDIDGDGDTDLIAGNLGHNYKFHTSPEKPLRMYCSDFDHNGSLDVVLAKNINGQYFPIRGRTCSSEQMPFIKEKFPSFGEFANANVEAIYGSEKLNASLQFEATNFSSTLLLNNGSYQFDVQLLPGEAQLAPINGIIIEDFDGDGQKDLLIAGNNYGAEVETTRADAGIGLFMKGTEEGYEPIPWQESGFFAANDVRSLHAINLANGKQAILVCNNNGPLEVFSLNR